MKKYFLVVLLVQQILHVTDACDRCDDPRELRYFYPELDFLPTKGHLKSLSFTYTLVLKSISFSHTVNETHKSDGHPVYLQFDHSL